MSNISTGRIERLAVNALVGIASIPLHNLKPEIPVDDKGISFDGHILVFKDHSESVESLISRIPVQVKGKMVEEFSSGTISFSLPLPHYKNYYQEGGVILFVGEVKEDGQYKLYYKHLLPLELKRIIDNTTQKKSHTIHLRPLDETTLRRVCTTFYEEKKKQPISLIENITFNLNQQRFTEYRVTSLTFDPNNPSTDNIFDHDLYIHGLLEDSNISVPLLHTKLHGITTTSEKIFNVNGTEFTFTTETTVQENEISYILNHTLLLRFSQRDNKFHFRFLRFYSLYSHIKILEFVELLFKNKTVTVNNDEASFQLSSSKELIQLQKEIPSEIIFLKELQKIYEQLKIREDVVITRHDETSEENIYEKFQLLRDTVLEGKFDPKKHFKNPDHVCFFDVRIGHLVLVLFYNSHDKVIKNAFDLNNIDVRIQDNEKKQTIKHSAYLLLNEYVLANGTNIDYEVIKQSFDTIDPCINDLAFSYTNNFVLDCINAYDKSQRIQCLNLAEYLLSKIIHNTYQLSEDSIDISHINQLQIKKRKNQTLSSVDIKLLIDLKHRHKDNIEFLFCINTLLESSVEASYYFSLMDEKMKEKYKGLPIFLLYSHLMPLPLN